MSPTINIAPDIQASQADIDAIIETVRGYAESWDTGEHQRMESALYPNLAKRIVRSHPKTGGPVLEWMAASELIEASRSVGGQGGQPPEVTVTLYDVFNNIATVKGILGCIDYIHLAKVDGRWQIVNVMWHQNQHAWDPLEVETSAEDIDAIRQAVSSYMLCWYGVGHQNLPPVLHPALVKRLFVTDASTGTTAMRQTTASQLVQIAAAEAQRTNHPPEDQWRNDIAVLDIFDTIATVKAVGSTWIDYIHLAKFAGQWQIVNILFDHF